ncbi:MAG: hypothetical protein L3J46_06515 [Kangiellaceae bacterium]|nr:hypothetical protein [Kangiellaceae bacterium]
MSSENTITINPSLPLIFPSNNEQNEDLDPNAAWHFYSHSIRRNPGNLKLHTHRVFFAMQYNDASLLSGSLHDLFYILKDAGEGLRIRLLKAAIPYLSKKETLYFAMWIKVGIKKGMGYKWVSGSVLADGLVGPDQALFTKKPAEFTHPRLSPLEEARSCMEYGQLDIAKDILEKALLKDADNTALREELAYLNQYTKSREIQPNKETS